MTEPPSSLSQGFIARHQDNFYWPEGAQAGKVNSVITAKSLRLGQLPCPPGQVLGYLDDIDLGEEPLELCDRGPQVGGRDAPNAFGLGESSAPFGVEEPDAGHAIGIVPETPGCP